MSVAERPPRRRWVWITGILLIGGVVGFFAWWQYFKTTPSYAVALLVDAAQKNDGPEFVSVVDTDRVIDNFISQNAPDSAAGLTSTLVKSVRVQLQSMTPETTARVKEGVKEEIRKRTNELAGSSSGRPFLVNALAVPLMAEVDQSGESARVKFNRNGQVELLMDRTDGNWKVTSLQDSELAGRVMSKILKALPQSPLDRIRDLPQKLPNLPLFNGK
jgi:hypothetical protein